MFEQRYELQLVRDPRSGRVINRKLRPIIETAHGAYDHIFGPAVKRPPHFTKGLNVDYLSLLCEAIIDWRKLGIDFPFRLLLPIRDADDFVVLNSFPEERRYRMGETMYMLALERAIYPNCADTYAALLQQYAPGYIARNLQFLAYKASYKSVPPNDLQKYLSLREFNERPSKEA